ncbi:hypothetical protein C8R44DRAFT_895528 [Mycena epipterygia]|nr:hypothetical protein C8R44DRAFT_895528 [Mycena epipterygia]
MADIVGLVASVLQLLDTASKARDYIHDFRNAPKDQQELLHEITHLRPLLQQVDKRIQGGSPAGADALQEFKEPLTRLNTIMEELTKKLTPDGISKTAGRRLAWPLWGKKDVEEGFRTIERLKILLNSWVGMGILQAHYASTGSILTRMGADIASAVEEAAGEQRLDHQYIIRSLKHSARENEQAHSHISESVRDVARKQEWYHESAERDRIIEWYSPLNFFLRQADIFNSREPGTGQWLLEHDLFKKWKSPTNKLRWWEWRSLWCRGMPGAGKTVFVSIIVDDLRTQLDTYNIGVAVIYLNHKELDAYSPSNLLTSLWRQLVLGKPIGPNVRELYQKHREPRTRPSLAEARTVLDSIIETYSKVFILVDGLDEYPEAQCDTLLGHLCYLGYGVKLLIASRPHITFNYRIYFETLEIRAREVDIRKYLEGQILKSPRLSKHIQNSPDLREAMEARIVQRSDGMFLLAKLHIDSLATKLTVQGVREALESQPQGMHDTLNEVVDRINRQDEEERALAWLVLSWVTNSRRPLEPSELRVALAVQEGTTELNTENLLDTETILSVCAGLVIINKEDNKVRPIHHTIQDYLERILDREFPRARNKITATCITYLLFETFPRHNIGDARCKYLFSTNPLLEYAVNYTLIHARGQPESDIKETIISFLDQCSGWVDLWNWSHRLDRIPTSGTRVWIAAFFDLRQITECLIHDEMVESHAVYMALVRGHTEVALILVGKRSYFEALGEYYGSALQFAISKRDKETVRLLLAHIIDINPPDRTELRTALPWEDFWIAVSWGNQLTIEVLLEGHLRTQKVALESIMSMQGTPQDALTAGYNFKRLGQTIFPNDVFTKEYILLPQFLAAKISEYVGSDVTGTTKGNKIQSGRSGTVNVQQAGRLQVTAHAHPASVRSVFSVTVHLPSRRWRMPMGSRRRRNIKRRPVHTHPAPSFYLRYNVFNIVLLLIYLLPIALSLAHTIK